MAANTPSLSQQAGFYQAGPSLSTKMSNTPPEGLHTGFLPPMVEQDTGCGSTIVKPLGAFTDIKSQDDVQRNPCLSARIDDDFTTCRTPLQVLQDILTDRESFENISEDAIAKLREKAQSLKDIAPVCTCKGGIDNGPYYIHLGHAASRAQIRKLFEARLGVKGTALRIESIKFSGKEGKTEEDCPIAKWVLRRTNQEEQYLVIVKQRFGHRCEYTWLATAIVQWDGLTRDLADRAYDQIATKTSAFGTETERQCSANKRKTCACQGLNMNYSGASYTFGCSWTMYHNICKFCRSAEVHKFKLKEESAEDSLASCCIELNDFVVPVYNKCAPDSYSNMCLFEELAEDCRIGTVGTGTGRPFSGITTVCDFCAHSHKDTNNMVGGATAVVTLLRPEDRDLRKPEEEQYHVLPLYVPDMSLKEIEEKTVAGGLEVLDKFSRVIAVREQKLANCRRGKLTQEKKAYLDNLAKECKDERIFSDPSLRPAGFNVEDSTLPQLDGLSVSDSEEDVDTMESSLTYDGEADLSSTMWPDQLAQQMESVKIHIRKSDCLEAFQDPAIGGVALALPHGSILIECAKAELHATTALMEPNRVRPHRIGLVFYQHKNLHHPSHGAEEFQRKRAIREFRDYVQWLKGNYVPTEAKLRNMCESGFVFPEQVKTILKPMDVGNPIEYFQFRAEHNKDDEVRELLNVDHNDPVELEAGYLEWLANAPEPEDEVDFRLLLHTDIDWTNLGNTEEVKNIEEKLEKEKKSVSR